MTTLISREKLSKKIWEKNLWKCWEFCTFDNFDFPRKKRQKVHKVLSKLNFRSKIRQTKCVIWKLTKVEKFSPIFLPFVPRPSWGRVNLKIIGRKSFFSLLFIFFWRFFIWRTKLAKLSFYCYWYYSYEVDSSKVTKS